MQRGSFSFFKYLLNAIIANNCSCVKQNALLFTIRAGTFYRYWAFFRLFTSLFSEVFSLFSLKSQKNVEITKKISSNPEKDSI